MTEKNIEKAKNEMENEISALKSQYEIAQTKKEKKMLMSTIKKYLSEYNDKFANYESINNFDILETCHIHDQAPYVPRSLEPVAYIYYFWNITHKNFKIIPLYSIPPLYELPTTHESFYLDLPAIITNDKPIYFITSKYPISFTIKEHKDFRKAMLFFQLNSATADVNKALYNSSTFLQILGQKPKIWKKVGYISMFVLISNLFQYIYWINILP